MLEKFPIFAGLPKEHLDQIEANVKKISPRKGSILFSPGGGYDAGLLCSPGWGCPCLQGFSRRKGDHPGDSRCRKHLCRSEPLFRCLPLLRRSIEGEYGLSDKKGCFPEKDPKGHPVCSSMDTHPLSRDHPTSAAHRGSFPQIPQSTNRELYSSAGRNAEHRIGHPSGASKIHRNPSWNDS
jgi:hypothetical protein